MIAFRDRKGRLWTARLDVAAAVRMRDLAELDVMALALGGREASYKVAADPSRLADALFALCLPSCEARRVTDTDFGRSLRGRMWGWFLRPSDLAGMLFDEVNAFFDVPHLSPGEPEEEGEPRTAADELWGDLWHYAAVAGVGYPGAFTFGELVAMSDGKRKHDWARTAVLQAAIENNAGFGRREKVNPADCDPTGGLGPSSRRSNRLPLTRENFGAAVSVFMGRG